MKTPDFRVVGRDEEIGRVVRAFEAVAVGRVPRTLAIEGPSGIGKSALVGRLATELAESSLVLKAVAFRIQSAMPFAVIAQLLAAMAAADPEERYVAGTALAADPGARLLALLEGVTLDRPVSIVVDDVQWIDDESAAALASLVSILADRPILVVLARRTEPHVRDLPLGAYARIALAPLGAREAASIARAVYPDAPVPVVDAIVAHAGGLPMDVVALAEGARDDDVRDVKGMGVATRTVIARRLESADPLLRIFLQTLALLPEPIEYELLRALWTDDELAPLVLAASERYLTVDGSRLAFRHALIAQAVLETIALKVPLRRRIIEALTARGALAVEERLILVEQAIGAGDRALAKRELLAVAREANERGHVRLVISASAQFLEIGEPDDETFLAFYGSYANALIFLDHNAPAVAVLERALREAVNRKFGHIGGLVAQMLLAQWFGGDPAGARETNRYYASRLDDPSDAAQLYAAALWIAVCDHDGEKVEATAALLGGLGIELSADVRARIEIARTFVACRSGRYAEARRLLSRVEAISREIATANRNLPAFLDSYLKFTQFGSRYDAFQELAKRGGSENEHYNDHYLAHAAILGGRLDDAMLVVDAGLRRNSDPGHRRRLLAAAAAVQTLRKEPGPHLPAIEAELGAFAAGERGASVFTVAAWCVGLPSTSAGRALTIVRDVLSFLESPFDPLIFVSPLALVVGAQRRNDKDLLSRIADAAIWQDGRPLVDVERRAAQALARFLCGKEKSPPDRALIDECEDLGLELPALLLRASGPDAARARARLDALGIVWLGGGGDRIAAKLTPRERQAAEQIAAGKSNREIADSFVLSERTIEGHVANIFNKLGVSSRTQIAAWYLTASAER